MGSGSPAVMRYMKELGIYFSRFEAADWNPYLELIKGIGDDDLTQGVIFATLNYETLLEEAIGQEGYEIDFLLDSGDYSEDRITVLKPHGSAHFLPRGIGVENVGVDPRIGIDGGEIQVADREEAIAFSRSSQNSLYPSMALYMEEKPTFMSESLITGIQERTEELLRETSEVFVVGVAPNPDDHHIWGALEENPGTLYCVGGEEAWRTWVAERNPEADTEYIGKEFEQHVEEILEAGGWI